MKISLELIKKLRQETSAGVSDCRQALEDALGDAAKAKKLIHERGLQKAVKKQGKETENGLIESYIHATGRVGVLVELRCETDFVAKTDVFRSLAHELALQIAAMNPKNVRELAAGASIRDGAVSVDSMIKSTITKVGENITVRRFIRYDLGA